MYLAALMQNHLTERSSMTRSFGTSPDARLSKLPASLLRRQAMLTAI
jgi:hypothetical protein